MKPSDKVAALARASIERGGDVEERGVGRALKKASQSCTAREAFVAWWAPARPSFMPCSSGLTGTMVKLED